MKVLERAAGHASGPYHLPVIDVESIAVRTNNPVCGAFRGFGANQAQFAMEGVIDRLAAEVGISAWEMRFRNAVTPGVVWGPGQLMDDGSLGARACLEAIRPAYEEAVLDGKAVGLGFGLKNSGLGNGLVEIVKAVVRFSDEGDVEVRHCWTEMGQGVHTVALQVAVEELGVDPRRVRGTRRHDARARGRPDDGVAGNAHGRGCRRRRLPAGPRRRVPAGRRLRGRVPRRLDESLKEGLENPVIHSVFSYAAQLVVVDRETGKIDRVLAVHDVGRAVNPLLCEGQIQGSVHMGLGYALSEDFPSDEEGRPTNTTLRSLGIIRPKDVPPIDTILVEAPQPRSPYGIKGVGEIGLVPTAGAVAGALHDLDGTWRSTLPMRVPVGASAGATDE